MSTNISAYMKIKFLAFLLVIFTMLVFGGCNADSQENDIANQSNTYSQEKNPMEFRFEALKDIDLINGSSYFMDFGGEESPEEAAITEGKLLSAFGEPAFVSEDYENSFNYVIKATSKDNQTVILSVYGVGIVHIGSAQQDDFAKDAAEALIEYVSAFEPKDFNRTVYYLDFNVQIDIEVKNGQVSIDSSFLSEEKAAELIDKWYN